MSQLPAAPLVLAAQQQVWQFAPRKHIDGWPGFGDEVRAMLERPFEPGQIRNDVKRHTDGFQPVYVEASTIIQRLNDAFNGEWDFEIISEQLVPPQNPVQVIVRGRLSIPHWIDPSSNKSMPHRVVTVKEQYGCCFIKTLRGGTGYVDIGSDFKAAATDALKKCATQLGIGLDLYHRDEAPMQGLHRTGGTDGQGNFPAQQANPNAPAESFQIESVRKMFANMNVPDGQWQSALQLTAPQQVTQALVVQLLSGEHPYVKHLMAQTGQQVGLRPTVA